MAHRHLLIEYPPSPGKPSACFRFQVDEKAAVGPWLAMLAARLGYPPVDQFGTPIVYRLRSISGNVLLPASGRFVDVCFPDGCRWVLEPDHYRTVPLQKDRQRETNDPVLRTGVSRRSLVSTGILATVSLLGCVSGVTTALAHHAFHGPQGKAPVKQDAPISVQMVFRHHQQVVRTVTWSPDERMLASGSNDGTVAVWKRDGTILYRWSFGAHVHALAWSPDGAQLVAGAANRVAFFDAQTGSLLAEQAVQHTASVTALGWTHTQGEPPLAVSASADTRAIVWNSQSHQPQVIFRRHTAPLEALALLATTIATASEGGLVRVWNALSGQEMHGYYQPTPHPLHAAAFSSLGALAIGSDDGMVDVWLQGQSCAQHTPGPFGQHCLDPVHRLQGHTGPVRATAFSPDGTWLATGGDDHTLILWSMNTMKPVLILPQYAALLALSWSPSGQGLAGACGTEVVIWNVHLLKQSRYEKAHTMINASREYIRDTIQERRQE